MRNSSVTQPLFKALKEPLSFAARRIMGTITGVETSEPVLALTFDDGPHPEYTPRLLGILDKYQAKATFFCVGHFAVKHPELIRRVAEAGHVTGNHTWSHVSLPLLPHKERRAQILKSEKALMPYGSHLLRPPYGHQSLASRLDLLQLGYQVVGWTHDSGDCRLTNPKQIVQRVLPSIRPGSILLFHDRIAAAPSPVYFDRMPMIDAVERLLKTLGGAYRFVTVPELSEYGQLARENWYLDADPRLLNTLFEEGNLPGRRYSFQVQDRVNAPFYM